MSAALSAYLCQCPAAAPSSVTAPQSARFCLIDSTDTELQLSAVVSLLLPDGISAICGQGLKKRCGSRQSTYGWTALLWLPPGAGDQSTGAICPISGSNWSVSAIFV